ncbi:MAG: HDOD domain-containing protein [Deltaproteobacteria bacterium]|nr:HDOD domain-containing protein [Deltaproteobacteria bacterium]MBW2152138.1 HDOD domain-containing protein [Deltaproteobacteria bacterium]
MEPLSCQSLSERIKDNTLLPSMPATVLAAQQLFNDPESSINQIAHLLKADPSMTAKILKVANSAYYGMRRRVDSIETALVILGLRTTYQLLQTLGVISAFSGRVETDFLRNLTRHSVIVAMTCSIIANAAGLQFIGVDYTAGLLHDMGHAAIHVVAPDHARLLRQKGDLFRMGCDKEQGLIGVDHCQAGKFLAETWGLPDMIGQCMASHHRSLNGDKELSIPAIIRLAVSLSGHLGHLHQHQPDVKYHVSLPEGHFASALPFEAILQALKDRLDEADEIAALLIH